MTIEEQLDEVEALKSIFASDVTETQDDQGCIRLTIKIYNNIDSSSKNKCMLSFALPVDYPNEPPIVDIIANNMPDFQKDRMMNVINEEINNNIGLPMIFSIISIIQDWWYIDTKENKKKVEEENLRIETEKYKRIDGTPVTPESFLIWKKRFDEERFAQLKTKDIFEEQENRPSGRQLFQANNLLYLTEQMIMKEAENDPTLFTSENSESLNNNQENGISKLNLDDIDASLFQEFDYNDVDFENQIEE